VSFTPGISEAALRRMDAIRRAEEAGVIPRVAEGWACPLAKASGSGCPLWPACQGQQPRRSGVCSFLAASSLLVAARPCLRRAAASIPHAGPLPNIHLTFYDD